MSLIIFKNFVIYFTLAIKEYYFQACKKNETFIILFHKLKPKMKQKKNETSFFIIAIAAILVIGIIMQPAMTGNTTGIRISNPKNHGITSSQSLIIGSDITKKLCAGSYTIQAAAMITDAVNRYNGGIKGAIMDGLGVPSTELPDVYGILASVASYFNEDQSLACLRQIGTKTCGKDWKGTLYVTFDRGKGSRIYKDWEYYYERVRYVGQGVDCTARLGCAFSYNPKTRKISKSCL